MGVEESSLMMRANVKRWTREGRVVSRVNHSVIHPACIHQLPDTKAVSSNDCTFTVDTVAATLELPVGCPFHTYTGRWEGILLRVGASWR